MTKTRLDVITMAHRRIEVLATDEEPTADQEAFAGDVLGGLFAEVNEVQGMAFTWGLEETPDAAFLPLSYLLAVEIAPHYGRPSESRAKAMGRLRAYAHPDDRADSRDTDEDGEISDAESQAGLEAAYF